MEEQQKLERSQFNILEALNRRVHGLDVRDLDAEGLADLAVALTLVRSAANLVAMAEERAQVLRELPKAVGDINERYRAGGFSAAINDGRRIERRIERRREK